MAQDEPKSRDDPNGVAGATRDAAAQPSPVMNDQSAQAPETQDQESGQPPGDQDPHVLLMAILAPKRSQ